MAEKSLFHASRSTISNVVERVKKKRKKLARTPTNEEEEEENDDSEKMMMMMCGAPARDRKEEGPDKYDDSDSSECEWEDVETSDDDDDVEEEDDDVVPVKEEKKKKEEEDVEIIDAKQAKKKRVRRITRVERVKIRELYYVELLCLLSRVNAMNLALSSVALKAIVLSRLPRNVVEAFFDRPQLADGVPVKTFMLERAVEWFHDHLWRVGNEEDEMIEIDGDEEAQQGAAKMNVVSERMALANRPGFYAGIAWKLNEILRTNRMCKGHSVSETKAALLCVMLRSLGIHARLCASLTPLPHDSKGPDLDRKTTLRSLDGKPVNIYEAMKVKRDDPSEIKYWVEALVQDGLSKAEMISSIKSPKKGGTKKKINDDRALPKFVPIAMIPTKAKFTIGDVDDIVKTWSSYPGYVVAFDEEREEEATLGILSFTDVTRKYSQKQFAVKVLKKRIKGDQRWNELTANHQFDFNRLDGAVENDSGAIDKRALYLKQALLKERKEMIDMQKSERPPKTLWEIKIHPLWCIEQHLRQNEWIYPKTGIAGCVEGKLIYPRENVKTLRTDRRWKTEKRLQVKEVELDSPIKKILSKKAKIARKQYGGTEEQYADISLYGDWQCSPYQPPKADKGIVPTNERGNVDLTKNGEGLPDGCAYIEDKNALVAARKLKNPPHAVSALVGFEYKQGGQTLPVFLGCVVTLENEERVKEQLIKDENERVKKEKAKKLKNASLKWRTLLGAMFIKERLTAEADQKASSEFQVSLASKVEKL
jgi:xeroderma pigmentosum group C-complementing protein